MTYDRSAQNSSSSGRLQPGDSAMAEQPMTDRERAKRLATDLARILAALDERLQRSVEPFAADSAILHFSLAFEGSWKL